jgi:hypothetical protein
MQNIIVITGASSGFGALAARAMARAGHKPGPKSRTSPFLQIPPAPRTLVTTSRPSAVHKGSRKSRMSPSCTFAM